MISVMTTCCLRWAIYQQLSSWNCQTLAAEQLLSGQAVRIGRYNTNHTWRNTLLPQRWQDAVSRQFSTSLGLCGLLPVHAGHEISLGKGEAAIFEEELDGQHTRHLAQGNIWLFNSDGFVIILNIIFLSNFFTFLFSLLFSEPIYESIIPSVSS